MTTTTLNRVSVVEWSVAGRPMPGQATSGDFHVVVATANGALLAGIDGLGHGEKATAAAHLAAQVIERHADSAVTTIVQQCHQALRETRGVVLTLAAIDTREQTVTTLGVGNVETLIFRANPRITPRRVGVLLRGGVVGYQLPALQADVQPLMIDDVIVFATDGVREDFADIVNVAEPVSQLAERVMANKFRGSDDGLVLACKYVGRA